MREKTQGDSGERERGSIKSIQSKPKTRKCDEMHKGVKRCFFEGWVFFFDFGGFARQQTIVVARTPSGREGVKDAKCQRRCVSYIMLQSMSDRTVGLYTSTGDFKRCKVGTLSNVPQSMGGGRHVGGCSRTNEKGGFVQIHCGHKA